MLKRIPLNHHHIHWTWSLASTVQSFPHRVTLLSCRRPSEAHQTRQSPWWNKKNVESVAPVLFGNGRHFKCHICVRQEFYRIFTYIYHYQSSQNIWNKSWKLIPFLGSLTGIFTSISLGFVLKLCDVTQEIDLIPLNTIYSRWLIKILNQWPLNTPYISLYIFRINHRINKGHNL